MKKILEGKEPSPQFYSKAFGKYDAVVEEGLNTSTQRQMQFAQLLQLREVGVPIPDDILLESATVTNKKELIEAVLRNQQANQQAQQVQAQSVMEEQQARTDLARARAVADRGLGLERASRVQENQALAGERRAQADKDRALAILDLVKAAKEIEGIDIQQIEKALAIANALKQREQTQSPIQEVQP